MIISLPQEKVKALHNELSFFSKKKRATKKLIMRLAGILSHSARVVRGGQTFSRRILDLLKGLPEGNPRIYQKETFRLDLSWWLSWANKFNGSCTLIKYNFGDSQYICSDSSLKGYGVTYDGNWIAGYYNSNSFPEDVF